MPGNDYLKDSYGLWTNTGWIVDTEGDLRPDVQFVTEGAYPRAYIRRQAEISFVLSAVDTTIGTLDTLRRLDLSFVGELVNQPDALGSSEKNLYMNFYLPHCGPQGKTYVSGYNRAVYHNLYPSIDLWFFSGQLGQKMMFVVNPGGNPDDIIMHFDGQSEMDVDLMGWLRIQMDEKYIVLPEAVAYQYDQNNTILPMNWTAPVCTRRR